MWKLVEQLDDGDHDYYALIRSVKSEHEDRSDDSLAIRSIVGCGAQRLRRAKLRTCTLYETRHSFATLMLELGVARMVAKRLGHTNVDMVYRRYHRLLPNLSSRDGANAAKGLALEGL